MKKTEVSVFMDIYAKRPKKSFLSGEDITKYEDSAWFLSCFAHVIPKNGLSNLVFPNKKLKDELLRHNEENIVLLTPVEHHLIDNGTEEQRQKHEKEHGISFKPFYDKKEKLIEQLKQKINEHL